MARKPKPPKELTSTSAFRAYLRTIDDLAEGVTEDRLTRDQALASQQTLAKLLTAQLTRLFERRLGQPTREQAEPPRIETYPVPRLRDLAGGTSYVHRAHFPPADQGGPTAMPADSPEVSADQPAPPRPWQRPFDPEVDE
jgi:uncharacterized coiled-coil protein SlyX